MQNSALIIDHQLHFTKTKYCTFMSLVIDTCRSRVSADSMTVFGRSSAVSRSSFFFAGEFASCLLPKRNSLKGPLLERPSNQWTQKAVYLGSVYYIQDQGFKHIERNKMRLSVLARQCVSEPEAALSLGFEFKI